MTHQWRLLWGKFPVDAENFLCEVVERLDNLQCLGKITKMYKSQEKFTGKGAMNIDWMGPLEDYRRVIFKADTRYYPTKMKLAILSKSIQES